MKVNAVNEFLRDQREGEDDRSQHPGNGNRDDHLDECTEPAQAVDHRRILEIAWDRLEEAHEQPGAEWHREAWIDEHQRPQRILQAERAMIREKGMKRMVGGTRYVRKIAMPRICAQAPVIRASA